MCISELQKRITSSNYMIVKSTGVVTFRDKNGAVQKRKGLVYLHFLEGCMQNYLEGFAYNKVTIGADTMKLLKKEDIDFLKTLGIQHFSILEPEAFREQVKGSRTIAHEENCPLALVLNLILTQTLTLTEGNFPQEQLSKHQLKMP